MNNLYFKSKLVSVILPVFNGENLISGAIKSVINQAYDNLELIIIDDNSTDNTKKVATSFKDKDNRIQIISNSCQSGNPAIVRNLGINAARGEFVAFIDHDDIWFKNKLARQVQAMEENPEISLIHSAFFIVQDKFPKYRFDLLNSPYQIGYCLNDLTKNNSITTSSVLLRKSILHAVGVFSELDKFRYAEDYELWLRIVKENKIAYLSEIHGLYRSRAGSFSKNEQVEISASYAKYVHNPLTFHDIEQSKFISRIKRKLVYYPHALYCLLIFNLFFYTLNLKPKLFKVNSNRKFS